MLREVWFTSRMALIVLEEWIFWTGTFMRCVIYAPHRIPIQFSSISETAYNSEKFAGSARSSFWQEQHVDEDVDGALLE